MVANFKCIYFVQHEMERILQFQSINEGFLFKAMNTKCQNGLLIVILHRGCHFLNTYS